MSEQSSTSLHPECFSVLQNHGQVMSTPPTLHQWLKESQTNIYFKNTGKGKEEPNYLLQLNVVMCLSVSQLQKEFFCLQSSYLSSPIEMVLSFSILMYNTDF